jgi:chemotaxis protein CheC
MRAAMELTAHDKDALTELLNIGYARAGAALSELTGQRITLNVPDVAIYPVDAITPVLQEVLEEEVTCVNQLFGGPISGNAMLLFDKSAARVLAKLLTNCPPGDLDKMSGEVMVEVGNILLNACLGSFGNLMQMNIKFTVPQLQIDNVQRVLRSVRIIEDKFECAMMIRTRFDLRDSDISGFLVILLSVTSLDRLLDCLQKWNGQ